jgi:adenylosuccinate synthase
MTAAEVIIGANFGDEGKGLLTDYFAAQRDCPVVVRHNGGAQAGHTVTTPDGKRHVFSHFCSGSFTGAQSFLSKYFVCNPLLFLKELALLKGKAESPAITVDLRAPVTTPYDMMLNQLAEETRGKARHGSCGMGFGETLERQEADEGFALAYGGLSDATELKKKLRHIRDAWVPLRLQALKIEKVSEQWRGRLGSDAVIDRFAQDTAQFLDATRPGAPEKVLGGSVVFEGAQGLLLDQERGWFPHVTRSHTGIRNALAIAQEAGIGALNVTYVTRAYATRHGAGPLPHELGQLPYPRITDATNVPNPHQGVLRFGWLDADLLAAALQKDLGDHRGAVRLRYGLAVTCLDQLDTTATCVRGGKPQEIPAADLPGLLQKAVGAEYLLASRGPTRSHIS